MKGITSDEKMSVRLCWMVFVIMPFIVSLICIDGYRVTNWTFYLVMGIITLVFAIVFAVIAIRSR